MSLFLDLGLLQRRKLALRQYDAFLGYIHFQCLEAFFEGLKIMPEPYRPHPTWGQNDPLLLQLV